MSAAEIKKGRPHLFAVCVALGLTLAGLFAGRAIAIRAERSSVAVFGPEVFPLKTQGLAFQRAAVQTPNFFPLYGSSEIGGPPGWKAADFFRTAPTGFQVSAVGKPGASTLILLQKIGALDRELRGKKVAISLSSNWFLGSPDPNWYAGNFSRFAASQLIFDSALSFRLKHDIAARMIQYPRSLEATPLLGLALRCLGSKNWLETLGFWGLWPLGKLQDTIWDFQDHFAAFRMIRAAASPPALQPQTLDWQDLVAKAEAAAAVDPNKQPHIEPRENFASGSRDKWFREHIEKAMAWWDLELLLRILQEIDARPLLLAMPMNGPYYNTRGISRAGRQLYYDKLGMLAKKYRAHLTDFADHDEDPNFLNPHLTAKGWILFDRAIDDFVHDRLPEA